MTTQHVLDQLPLWVEGDLNAREMAAVEGHLAECPACQGAAKHLKNSQNWLRDAMASPFAASDQGRLHHRVMDQIRAEAASKSLRRFTVRPALLAACAASLLVVTLVWHQQRGDEIQAPLLVAQPPPKVAEQPSQPGPQANAAGQTLSPSAHIHPRPVPAQASESPPPGEPTRIEFQTSDPNIRIIWLAQAKPLPGTNPTIKEAP